MQNTPQQASAVSALLSESGHLQQEANLAYVAFTRSQNTLAFVN